ncbi:nucleic acid-binding protein [Vagococcus martis]|uniref:Nucleic acid-binding protein n=1 Tax=Vagococcus martis TaxID=1768210 RepID=A0A1V4DJR3_9ENTE|nr:YceD family protein [Vagococcus martis]OPF88765.1 nucleic acid-binding protein [Vagococcus martis]
MKWALSELNKFRGSQVDFEETIDLNASLKQREPSIIDISPIKVNGFLKVDELGYYAHMTVETILTVPSSRSLEPVELPLDLIIDEEYMTPRQYDALKDVPEDDKNLIIVLEKDLIDLTEAIEDFILLNLPLQVLTEEEKQSTELPKGDFWQVVSEDDIIEELETETQSTIDPRLAKLSDFFKEDEQ